MSFELSGDENICSNYMSFRIVGSLIFDTFFMKNGCGEEKVHLISNKPNVLILQNLGSKWL